MEKINILQIGLGPLGVKIGQYISERKNLETIAAVDINPSLIGKDFGNHVGESKSGVAISSSMDQVTNMDDIDVVILTTSSDLDSIANQIDEIAKYNKPIISTCEELSYPWHIKSLSNKINEIANKNNVSILGTGVNPGFLMDTLPSMLTGVCKDVEEIEVRRIQDAIHRRIPFQNKIGAGLTPDEFEQKKQSGKLRHVGLEESIRFLAQQLDWELDQVEDIISPIFPSDGNRNNAIGVQQIGKGFINGQEKIKLVFRAGVGLGESYDEIIIKGTPDISSRIEGGVNGDIATCAIVINAIPNILNATPGLKTMADVGVVSCR